MEPINIRPARRSDMTAVHALIVELAVYEKEPDAVETTVADLEEHGFGENPRFDCLVAEVAGEVIGFALFYTGFSTWKGPTVYLEDFLVTNSWRRKGVGDLLFQAVKAEATRRGVRRMDWQVLEWNEPAVKFYQKHGATLDPIWWNGRFFEADLKGQ